MQNISTIPQLYMVWLHTTETYIGKAEKKLHPSLFTVTNDTLMSCSRIKDEYIPGLYRYVLIIQMINPLTLQNNSNLRKIMAVVIMFTLFAVNFYPK